MITSYKALLAPQRNLFQRVIFSVTGVLAIGVSSVSLAQFHESDFYSTGSYLDSCQSSGCEIASHECAGCQATSARLGGGKIAGYVSGVRYNAAILKHRETPPGNMGLHFPYQANQMYYYRRPYNDFHVPMHVGESKDSPARSTFGENLGYSNQIFERAHEAAEQYHEAQATSGGGIEKDGLLEFVDWRKHRQSRLNWEATPRYHSDYQDDSYPYLNEEVKNQRTDRVRGRYVGRTQQPLNR